MILTERVYGYANKNNFYKIFVDRLWPRGISRDKAPWNEWIRDIAPGNELRKWFGHRPERWTEFREKYLTELSHKQSELQRIKNLEKVHGTIVLLYAARDTEHNNAIIIREILMKNIT